MMPALTLRAKMSGRRERWAAAAVRSSQRGSPIVIHRGVVLERFGELADRHAPVFCWMPAAGKLQLYIPFCQAARRVSQSTALAPSLGSRQTKRPQP